MNTEYRIMNVEVYPPVKVKPHWDAENRDWRVCPFVIHHSVFDIRHSEKYEITQLGIVTQPVRERLLNWYPPPADSTAIHYSVFALRQNDVCSPSVKPEMTLAPLCHPTKKNFPSLFFGGMITATNGFR